MFNFNSAINFYTLFIVFHKGLQWKTLSCWIWKYIFSINAQCMKVNDNEQIWKKKVSYTRKILTNHSQYFMHLQIKHLFFVFSSNLSNTLTFLKRITSRKSPCFSNCFFRKNNSIKIALFQNINKSGLNYKAFQLNNWCLYRKYINKKLKSKTPVKTEILILFL